ncbi:carbohydrate ABC transporter permease [Microbacterium kyungheense]|uniref:Carbohydrate ABC transporter membrane protein 2 (CUT1 family) n=1 Tax=Microbacterium kyungheense TaxID=1263636 RepID=A0A543FK64_9MICO|nr:carbohydrate ABC transporter permease [Microbacterium kyungheense]TQM34172.1 carbohydrate ABC transporter membrane protein 2 (CUT1 family) [Microbacterium kyungheense]
MAAQTATETRTIVTGRRSLSVAAPRKRTHTLTSSVLLSLIGLLFLVPLLWVVFASFDGDATVSMRLPETWTLTNYTDVMTWELAWQPLLNSIVISLGTAIITVVVALLAAYPLSRYNARYQKPFMYGILFGTGLPLTAMMVPVYALFVSFGLLDSTWGVILFMAATSLPMAIWMLKNFMDSVPISLEEAAWVDGANSMQALARVVVPLMRPGIGVVFIFVFTGAWGNFFVPFVLLFTSSKFPAAVSIFNFFGQYGTIAYGQLAAYSVLYAAPMVVLYVIVQKLSGASFALAGSVKG